eukprot:2574028-Prymnesium_polylepis.1
MERVVAHDREDARDRRVEPLEADWAARQLDGTPQQLAQPQRLQHRPRAALRTRHRLLHRHRARVVHTAAGGATTRRRRARAA